MTEDIFKGRKKMRRQLRELRQLHENASHPDGHTDYAAPGHALAEGYCDEMQAKPDETKAKRTFGAEARIPVSSTDQDHEHAAQLAARAGDAGSIHVPVEGEDPSAVKTLGTPPANPHRYALAYAEEQAAKGAPCRVDQQPARAFGSILASLRANPYHYLGQAGFNGTFAGTDNPVEAPGDQVQVRGFDAAGAAGGCHGMMPVDIAPRQPVREYRSAPIGANNGSHSLSNPESHAVSNKSQRDIMKETQRIIT